MDTGYKHFSHAHNLVMHQAHEAAKMTCSGCNSLVTGTMYVCWQCNFMLHEQCFRATRSLNHPSHPSHPLTLVPYPTYPSNSFYCNSCKLAGNGFSYSCSDCEFDLHVHCAHNPIQTTSIQHSYMHSQHQPVGFVSADPIGDSDRERIKKNEQMLEMEREEDYRLGALATKYALGYI